MAAIALCEMSLNRGVPVLQAMSMSLWRNSSQSPNVLDSEKREALFSRVLNFNTWDSLVARGMQPQSISIETRLSFQKAFGITVQEQISWEQYLDQWTCGFGEPVRVCHGYWNSKQWCCTLEAPGGYNVRPH